MRIRLQSLAHRLVALMVRRTSLSVEFSIDGLGSPSYRPYPITTSLNQRAVTYRVMSRQVSPAPGIIAEMPNRNCQCWHSPEFRDDASLSCDKYQFGSKHDTMSFSIPITAFPIDGCLNEFNQVFVRCLGLSCFGRNRTLQAHGFKRALFFDTDSRLRIRGI
jgi:hypothetical protein